MKKRCFVFLVLSMVALAGCTDNDAMDRETVMENSEPTERAGQKTAAKEIVFKETDSCPVGICEYALPVPEHASVDAFCCRGENIYYGISYGNYIESFYNIGESFEFSKEYSTQIRRYRVSTGEDALIYQYEEDRSVQISDMQQDQGNIIWEDYLTDNGWRVVSCAENGGQEPEVLFTAVDVDSTMATVTPHAENGNVYWYDKKSDEWSTSLYVYSFQEQSIDAVERGLDLASPYEQVSSLDGVFAMNFRKEGMYGVRVDRPDGTKSYVENGDSMTCDPKANSRYCIWSEADSSNSRIYVYDFAENIRFVISPGYFFSYGLLSDYLIVNSGEGVLVYNLKDKTCCNIMEGKEHIYLFTVQDSEECLYAQKTENENIIGVISIQ